MPRRKKVETAPMLDVSVGDVVRIVHPVGSYAYHTVIGVDQAGGSFQTDDLLVYSLESGVEVDEPLSPRRASVPSDKELADYNELVTSGRLADELQRISTSLRNVTMSTSDAFAAIDAFREKF